MSAPGRDGPAIDLHLHSSFSDGLHPPERLGKLAREVGLEVVALVDHDETRGLAAFRAAAEGLRCIDAIELTVRASEGPLGSIHVLGYGIDPAAAALSDLARRNRLAKRRQIEAILVDLERSEGIAIAWDEVAGGRGEDAYVGRNQIAEVLVRRGHVKDRRKAFRRWLEAKRVPEVEVVPAAEGIAAIRAAGGIAVLAHPTHHDLDRHLRPLLPHGLEGIEVHRPRANGSLLARIEGAAAKHGLLVTGGSDWHGHHPDPPIGTWRAPHEPLRPFLERLGLDDKAMAISPLGAQ